MGIPQECQRIPETIHYKLIYNLLYDKIFFSQFVDNSCKKKASI